MALHWLKRDIFLICISSNKILDLRLMIIEMHSGPTSYLFVSSHPLHQISRNTAIRVGDSLVSEQPLHEKGPIQRRKLSYSCLSTCLSDQRSAYSVCRCKGAEPNKVLYYTLLSSGKTKQKN